MDDRIPANRDAEVLPDAVAARLLKRASELDAAGAKVADLRAAAAEAGISGRAFDAALAELREAGQAQVPDVRGRPRRRPRMRALAGVVAFMVAFGAFAVARSFPGTAARAAAPMVEEAFLLRCLTPGQAAALVRPHLDASTTVVASPVQAPGVLTIRGTPAQIQKVRSVLDQNDGAGSSACASGVGTAPAPPRR